MFKFGIPILREDISSDRVNKDKHPEDITKIMAKMAMDKKNENGIQNEASKTALGEAEKIDVNRTTSFMIYNATGSRMIYRSRKDSSGEWTRYLPEDIEVGEWGVCTHKKMADTATGSIGAFSFNIPEYNAVLSISFKNPYSSSNGADCELLAPKYYSEKSWDDIFDEADHGTSGKYNSAAWNSRVNMQIQMNKYFNFFPVYPKIKPNLKVTWSITSDNLALMTITVYRDDIGY